MEWSDLPYFLAVARTGQIARAAGLVGTDATTVGRRIRRLESALGKRLFEQGRSGQTLTPAGAQLLERVEAMARLADEIGQDETMVRGSIRVSVAEGFGTWFIARHLGELADAHPDLTIDLVANTGFLNPTRRETDLAVLLDRPRRGPLITRKLTDYALNLYASQAYLDTRSPLQVPGDLDAHRLVSYIPDIIYSRELDYVDELPVSHVPQLRSSSINAQHGMIASGAGVGVLPCFIGDADPSLVRVLPSIRIVRSFWMATHRETHPFAPVRLFSAWLVALAEKKQDWLMGRHGP